ncbi:hypothetical protein SNE40_002201 [Patella caerulea]|uniref:STAS domain-containing protein n=2 Tax=Patella caerulea TaxID=87958 RepID=A0AAN8QE08_PATCE
MVDLTATTDEHAKNDNKGAKETTMLRLTRKLYTHESVEAAYKREDKPVNWKEILKGCSCSKICSFLLKFVPIITEVQKPYIKDCVVNDLIAGLSVAFMHLPQALGFGVLASLQPVNGLYTTFFPLICYIIFGTSPHISFGTTAIVSMMTSSVVEREEAVYWNTLNISSNMSINDPAIQDQLMAYKVQVSMTLCFVVGVILTVVGILRLGFVSTYLSESFIGGFTFACAIYIATSQLSKALNISVGIVSGPGRLLRYYIILFSKIHEGNWADFLIAVFTGFIILAVNIGVNQRFRDRMKIPVPIDLIVVVLATLISKLGSFEYNLGVDIVGDVKSGVPAPQLPDLSGYMFTRVVADSFLIAVVIFTATISMAKLCAQIHGNTIDDNQEAFAYGVTNIVASLFMCFPASQAHPRTMMLSTLKVKSTLSGVSSALLVLILLLGAGPLFAHLPIAVLAAMIIVAMKDLFALIRVLPYYWRVSKSDFLIWVLTACVSLATDLEIGIYFGVSFSILTVMFHSCPQWAKGYLLARAKDEDLYLDKSSRVGLEDVHGVKIFTFDSKLYFATAEIFRKDLYEQVYTPVKLEIVEPEKGQELAILPPIQGETIHHIIIDCSHITYIDITGINILRQLVVDYRHMGTEIFLTKVPPFTVTALANSNFFDVLPMDSIFFDVNDAVQHARVYTQPQPATP